MDCPSDKGDSGPEDGMPHAQGVFPPLSDGLAGEKNAARKQKWAEQDPVSGPRVSFMQQQL